MLSELHSQETPQEKTAAELAAQKAGTRDGEIYKALGYFIMAVGIPVLIGTFFAFQHHNVAAAPAASKELVTAITSEHVAWHAGMVNLVCSLVLLSIGAAAWVYGGIVLRRHR